MRPAFAIAPLLSLLLACPAHVGGPPAAAPTGPSAPGGAAPETTDAAAPAPTAGSLVMPDVAGLTVDEAKAKLVAAGKTGEASLDFIGMGGDDCKALGDHKVRSTSPGAGQTVGGGTPYSIDVCGTAP